LLDNRLVFETGPYEAQVGFSNYCNMSCIMCWNGANPPLRKMAPELVEQFELEIAPSLSIMTPFDGSEPLIAGWDETRRIARTYGIKLCLTTNVQYLDEKRFFELSDITETLYLSIDSHIPEVFARIRPRSKPERVFANLPRAIALANEHGLECQVNIVFMTENAPHLPDTIAYLARVGAPAVHVLQLIDGNGESGHLNPLVHFPADYVRSLKERCIDIAREERMRLVWDVGSLEDHDFRTHTIGPDPSKADYDHWDWRMRHHLPGYCRFVRDRLRITVDGSVAPCSYSTNGELELGKLGERPFGEMWNGVMMRDLRRAHTTWDHPAICASCRFSDPPPPAPWLPFLREYLVGIGEHPKTTPADLELVEPAHMTRGESPPRTIEMKRPEPPPAESYVIVIAFGGEAEHVQSLPLEPIDSAGDVIRFEFPQLLWQGFRPNLGYWWFVCATSEQGEERIVRRSQLRCVIRHRPIPRLEGSPLRYPDEGNLPVVDLGSWKGAADSAPLFPPRPKLGRRSNPTAFDGPRRFEPSAAE
jgi:radical SAM protein with 4Fe4S-binding SPASM domain